MPLLSAVTKFIKNFCTKDSKTDLPTTENINEFRKEWRKFGLVEMVGPSEDVKYEDYAKNQLFSNSCPIRIYNPQNANDKTLCPALLFFPGGGFIANDLGTNHTPCSRIARYSQCRIITVNYRTAPEAPYPAGLEDAYRITDWLFTYAEKLGIDKKHISIGGDSSGGNFAALSTYYAVKSKGLPVYQQILISPITDLSFQSKKYKQLENYDLLFSDLMVQRCYDLYVPKDVDRQNPSLSPLYIHDLRGLPPTAFLTAEYDRLRSDTEVYAEKLASVGVPVYKKIFPGQVHAFFTIRHAFKAYGDEIGEDPVDTITRCLQLGINHLLHIEKTSKCPTK